jgi:hypothetical protein
VIVYASESIRLLANPAAAEMALRVKLDATLMAVQTGEPVVGVEPLIVQ